MLHACFVRSPFARARLGPIDTSEALAIPGVHAVFTAADLNPDVHELAYTAWRGVPDSQRPPLSEGEVRFVGDPVAMVVAVDRYVAEDAAALVDVEYEALPAVVDYATAEQSEHLVWPEWPANLLGHTNGRPSEELAPIFDRAHMVVDETIFQQSYARCRWRPGAASSSGPGPS